MYKAVMFAMTEAIYFSGLLAFRRVYLMCLSKKRHQAALHSLLYHWRLRALALFHLYYTSDSCGM